MGNENARSIVCSAQVADRERRPLLLHRRCGTTAAASAALQGETLIRSFIHSFHSSATSSSFFPPFFAPESRDLGAPLSQLTSFPPSAADRPRGERRQLRRAEEGRQDLPVSDVSGAPLHRADPHGAQRPAGGELVGEPVPVSVCLNGNTVLITHEVGQNTTGRFTRGICLTCDA